MRQIKFKAWDDKNKVMMPNVGILGLSESFAYGHNRDWLYNSMEWGGEEEFIQSPVLLQYTGLNDKNGKEIYEGDVVTTNGGHPAEVIWQAYIAKFLLQSLGEGRGYLDWFEKRFEPGFEVIGNIYENPELLNKPTEK
jgi:hypothetical protein